MTMAEEGMTLAAAILEVTSKGNPEPDGRVDVVSWILGIRLGIKTDS